MRRLAYAFLIGALASASPAVVAAQEYAPPGGYAPAPATAVSEEIPFDSAEGGWTDSVVNDGGGTAGICSLNPTPYWYATANALWLSRERVKDNLIVVDDGNGLGTPVLSTGAFDLSNYELGAEFSIGYQLDPVAAVELSYFGLQEWNSSASATGNNSLSLPGLLSLQLADFAFADSVLADYNSKFHNAEANYKQTMYGLTFLGGFRYVNVGEELNLQFTDLDSGTSDLNIHALNNLYGGQVGVGWHEDWGPVSFDLLGKVGIFGNQATVRQNVRDLNNTVQVRDLKAASNRSAFLGEVGLNTTWQVSSWFLIRGGYRVMWLDGIAMAPANMDFSDGPDAGTEILDRSSLILHGAHVGAEMRW
jgi:hypothetical protein